MKTSSRKALAESYNRLFENIAGRGEEHMVDTIAIRTMSKAYYSTENIGHYGLPPLSRPHGPPIAGALPARRHLRQGC